MGIPCSTEICAALDLVAPLKQTFKIAIVLALVLQILTVCLLSLILLANAALIICVIPELRDALVTPRIKWLVQKFDKSQERKNEPQAGQALRERFRQDRDDPVGATK
jgi:hypothetical protein